MWLLLAVSLLWAFSFGLIKGLGLDSSLLAAARLGLALLVLLPFFRWRGLAMKTAALLVAIGAVQFGLMYLAYNESFRFLASYETALLTLTTPIFVTLFADALERRFQLRALLAALIAVIGASLVVKKAGQPLLGIALVQLSNLAFAIGQVLYKRLRTQQPALRDRDVFALLFLGGFMVAFTAALLRGVNFTLTPRQMWVVAYLGVLASGVGFFLWNVGATKVRAGTLAVMNNAKIPLAVAVSLLVFGERASVDNLTALLASLGLMTFAVWLAEKK